MPDIAENTTKISIGVLAHNEEDVIAGTLRSLFAQTVFKNDSRWESQLEVICIPNGCTDRTDAIARETLLEVERQGVKVSKRVCPLVEAGKANAWNMFVHELSAKSSEYLILVDADIEFGVPDALERMIDTIARNQEAVVAVSQPLKDIAKKPSLTWTDRLLLAIAVDMDDRCPGLAGSLYIARSTALRTIYMPKGLTVEDGFLRAMLLTENFTKQEMCKKIVRAQGAYHYYETLRSIPDILSHEVRVLGGTVMNTVLFDFFSREISVSGMHAGEITKRLSADSPSWVSEYVTNQWSKYGLSIISRQFFVRRFGMPRGSRGPVVHGIIVAGRSVVDWMLLLVVIWRIKSNTLVGRW